MSSIFIKAHLGLGDSVLLNGLVRVLAKDHKKVFVPAKFHNAEAVEWMFSDLPNVEVVSVKDDQDMLRQATGFRSIGVGLWSRRGLQPTEWDKAFYEDAGVPFECRWSEFKLPDDYQTSFGTNVFMHRDMDRGYNITRDIPSIAYEPSPRWKFSDHITPLQSADQIHVIDSCFLCLADSIATNAKRHVLHLYATAHDPYKKFGPPTLRKNWEILR